MTGSSWRESDLHDRFRDHGLDVPDSVVIPSGDDMAMLRREAFGEGVLIAADQVVVGRHVVEDADPEAIGRKAVLRNLSDVAAMAARPVATVATATLDPARSRAWAERLHAGLHRTALEFEAPLVGGDLAIHDRPDGPTVVSVTILATPANDAGRVLTRRGARVGDLLAVTGRLGGSLEPGGGGRHLDFPPRVDVGIGLEEVLGQDLHAMIDLSDGLGLDACRLATASDLAISIDVDRVPMNPGTEWRAAVEDGEDYELLFATSAPPPSTVHGVPVTVIGEFVAGSPGRVDLLGLEQPERIDGMGWDHTTTRSSDPEES